MHTKKASKTYLPQKLQMYALAVLLNTMTKARVTSGRACILPVAQLSWLRDGCSSQQSLSALHSATSPTRVSNQGKLFEHTNIA